MPTSGQLKRIEKLTRGNPLLIHSFAHVARKYESWNDINFKEMTKVVEEDEKYGLLYYFTEKVASDAKYSNELWKLAVPRVIIKEIEPILFEEPLVFKSLIDAGLVFEDSEKYTLHDEVLMAIKAHGRKELKEKHLTWHDNPKVIELHKKLVNFYEERKQEDFESCYHKMMIRTDIDFSLDGFSMSKEDFIHYFLGSLFIGHEEKFEICNNFMNLDIKIVKEKTKQVIEEVARILPQMSNELYETCLTHIGKGKIKNGIYDIKFLKSLLLTHDKRRDILSINSFLAQSYMYNKEYDNAIEIYTNSLDIDEKREDWYYLLIGNVFYQQNKYDEALECYKVSINLNNQRTEAFNNMGTIYAFQDKHKEALKYYQKAIDIKPTYIDYHLNKSQIHFELEEYEKALKLCDEAKKINPDNERIYIQIGDIYQKQEENLKKSIDSYRKAIQINPKNEYTYNKIGIVFYKMEKYQWAIEIYQEAIRLNSKDEWFNNNIADAYFMLKRYDKSILFYEQAIKINSKEVKFYNSAGKACFKKVLYFKFIPWYKKIGKDKELERILFKSVGYYEKAILLEPKNIKFYMGVADAYYKNNYYDMAIRIFTKLIEHYPRYGKALHRRAHIYLDKKKDYKYSLKLYKELVNLSPNFSWTYLKLGDCYLKLKDYNQAILAYIEFIEKDKTKDEQVYTKIITCYFYNKDFSNMIKWVDSLIRIKYKKLKKEVDLWISSFSEELVYLFFIGVLGIGSTFLFLYIIFLMWESI